MWFGFILHFPKLLVTGKCKFSGRVACDFLSEGQGKSGVNQSTAHHLALPLNLHNVMRSAFILPIS
jgi:hypothetical protein